MMLPANRLTGFISQNQLFDHSDVILAAVSGGMDSVLMARMLAAAGYRFAIAHCNFKLRDDEADADQAFCRLLADELNVQFHTINFDTLAYAAETRQSVQMAARQLRYNWFSNLQQQHGYTCIALAHHQNDTIETILLNLTRGTGIAGLHGILPKNGSLVRPMLFLQRQEIAQIVADEGIAYREDSSNASTKYARNKIRHEVIPVLKQLNPSLEETFERSLTHFRQLEQLLEAQLLQQRTHFVSVGSEVHLPLFAVRQMHPQNLLLFNLLKPYGFNETQVNDLITALDKHAGRIFSSATHNLYTDRDKIIITDRTVETPAMQVIERGDEEVMFGLFKLTLLHDDTPLIVKDNCMAASVDADLLVYPLSVRTWRKGDYFYPLGMKGRQKLSDFFVQQKIPLHQKKHIPVLLNGNGDVVWIGGYRLDNRYKVSNKTEKVIIFELYKLP